jgi:hypothetical protein
LFFSLLGAIPPAALDTLGPQTGLRQMVQRRYNFGLYAVGIVALLNLATTTGWTFVSAMMFTLLLKSPNDERRRMLESHLVFGCNGSAVDTIIVDGNIVVKGRKVLGVDEEQVRQDMDKLFNDLVDAMPKVTVEREKRDGE